jgi:tetratricopeptide (TPR) repeat protein
MLAFFFGFMKSKSLNLQKLAVKLIASETASGRKSLLKDISEADFLELAKAVKELCYSFWTSEPTKAQASAKALENIYKFSPQKEIKAYSEWINGIAEITRGNLVLAIKKLDGSAAIFSHLGKEREAAQTQGAKLYALAFLGRYDEAIKAGKKALRIFEISGDKLASGKIQINIGNLFWRQDHYQLAEKYYLSARNHFVKIKDNQNLAVSENSLAIVYAGINNFLKAEKFYTQALLILLCQIKTN